MQWDVSNKKQTKQIIILPDCLGTTVKLLNRGVRTTILRQG